MQPAKLVKAGAVPAQPKPEPKPAALPPPKPAPKPQPPSDLLILMRDQRVTIVQRGGVVMSGMLRAYRGGWLHLEDCEITGIQHRSRPGLALVERSTITLIHPSCDFEKIAPSEDA
jgi:small nuclear ribonucleoprotein (snRNP)-like protein